MKFKARVFPLLLATMALGQAAFANAMQGEKIELKWNVQPDQRFEYTQKVSLTADGFGSAHATLHYAERITDVGDDIGMSMYIAGASGEGVGALEQLATTFQDMKGLSFTRRVGFDGKETAMNGVKQISLGSTVDLVLPKTAVGVGDTWTNDLMMASEIGKVLVTYKLVKFDANNAVVEATLSGSEAIKSSTPYTFVVERSSGRYTHSSGKIEITAGGVTIMAEYSLKRLIPAVKD